ncbi:MAG TPA: hypothetical protein VFA40_18840 [Terriglobales bacterium]|nr:hypothetical protein [Terriglobales bacterium]
MPIRFDLPGLGRNIGPLKAHEWQVDVAYRYLYTDQFYVGSEINDSAGPFGKGPSIKIHSWELTVNYGVTSRLSLALRFPFSAGSATRLFADNNLHTTAAAGLGDISAIGTVWLWNPTKHTKGNLALGFGVKTPSGDNAVIDRFFPASGPPTRAPVDQSIQLGDGGWGVILQTQAYRAISSRTSGYVNASYLLSAKEKTDVPSPIPGGVLGVPDIYSVRVGVAYALLAERGLSMSLGPRIDGIPIRDLIGGGDNNFRRPGYSLFIDPGVTFNHGRNTFWINVPIRIHQDFKRSLADIEHNRVGGGDLAKYLVFTGYSVRF